MKFKCRFVLNNAGGSGQFRAIQGVRNRHIFYPGPQGFELKFEGTMDEYTPLMKDIFGRNGHPCAIFVLPEVPDVLDLQTQVANLNEALVAKQEAFEAVSTEQERTISELRGLLSGHPTGAPLKTDAFSIAGLKKTALESDAPGIVASGPDSFQQPPIPFPLERRFPIPKVIAAPPLYSNLDTLTPAQKRKDTIAAKARDKEVEKAKKKSKAQAAA